MNRVWEIELFGWLRAVHPDRVISRFRSQQTALLLAYLAYYRQRSHTRETLIEILWPGCDPNAGRHRLRMALSSLRSQLEPPGVPSGTILLADRASIQLSPAACETDVGRFEDALQAATRSTSTAERVQRLADAVERYRGELLPGYFGDWIIPERQRCGEAALHALSQLIAHLEQARDFQRALQYALRAVGLDPLREESHHDLMRLWKAMGQPEAALRQYQSLEGLLRRELGVQPGPEIQNLARTLERVQAAPLEGAAALRHAPTVPPSFAPQPSPETPVVDHSEPLRTGTITYLVAELVTPSTPQEPHAPPDGAEHRHMELLRTAARECMGHEVGSTDGVLQFAFGRVSDALAAAVRPQMAASSAAGTNGSLSRGLRVALHLGEVRPAETLPDSAALRHTLRLLLAAHGDQILLSEETAAVLRRDMPGEMRLVDLGAYHVLGGSAPERIYQVNLRRRPTRGFPPLKLTPAHEGSLPLCVDRFFGRAAELQQLCDLLGDQLAAADPAASSGLPPSQPRGERVRLVTLTGPGGTGKTRLALEAGGQLEGAFRGAVWFVPLQELTDPLKIADEILTALRVPRSLDQEPLDQVVDHGSRQPSLLILDNLEHLVDGAAAPIRMLLERTRTLTLLLTSRRRLEIPGEREFPVGSLPTPDVGAWEPAANGAGRFSPGAAHDPGPERLDALRLCPSVQLFVDRAQAVRPDFQLRAGNAGAIAELCRRLEGLPLALELAAARATVTTPSQMLSRLEQRFDFLTRRGRPSDQRHCSVRAALDWSFELLPPELQRFFAQLSVFRGGWTLGAAECICQQPQALVYLEELRISSLVLGDDHETEARFRLLETLREYGAEQLTPEQWQALSRRHAGYFLATAEEADEAIHRGPAQKEWLDRLETEHDNLRGALRWACESREVEIGLRLAAALGVFWDVRRFLREGREHLAALLALPEAAAHGPARARALIASGNLAVRCGKHQTARELHKAALAIYQAAGDHHGTAECLRTLGVVAQVSDDFTQAARYAEQGLALFEAAGDLPSIARCLNQLGLTYLCNAQPERARPPLERALAINREIGSPLLIAVSQNNLGLVLLRLGRVDQAESFFAESLRLKAELGSAVTAPWGLEGLAAAAAAHGQMRRSASLFAAAESLRRSVGHPLTAPARRAIEPDLWTRAQLSLDPEEFAVAWAEGEALSLEDAVRLACEGCGEKAQTTGSVIPRTAAPPPAW